MVTISFNNLIYEKGIEFEENKKKISIAVEGHSLFDKKGKDIVCAAISVLSQTMILTISGILHITQNYIIREGYLKTEIDISDLNRERKNNLKIILDFFCIGIFEIAKNYPDAVDIFFENE